MEDDVVIVSLSLSHTQTSPTFHVDFLVDLDIRCQWETWSRCVPHTRVCSALAGQRRWSGRPSWTMTSWRTWSCPRSTRLWTACTRWIMGKMPSSSRRATWARWSMWWKVRKGLWSCDPSCVSVWLLNRPGVTPGNQMCGETLRWSGGWQARTVGCCRSFLELSLLCVKCHNTWRPPTTSRNIVLTTVTLSLRLHRQDGCRWQSSCTLTCCNFFFNILRKIKNKQKYTVYILLYIILPANLHIEFLLFTIKLDSGIKLASVCLSGHSWFRLSIEVASVSRYFNNK